MTIPLIKVPRYKMTLPFSKEVVEYRPFLVKEEKILIMAKESQDANTIIEAMGDVVRDCTGGKIDVNNDPMFDVQYAFLQIRGKSIGEEIEYFLRCGKCDNKTTTSTNVNDFTLQTHLGHSNVIKLDHTTTVTMRYPTFNHFIKLFDNDEELRNIYEVVAECIKTIVTDEEVTEVKKEDKKEMVQFVDNLLPEQFERLEQFFTTIPILQYTATYVCGECGETNHVRVDGINNFFD